MAQYALLARDSGAKIIGGCCGTAYEHIRAMKLALETTPLGNPPSDDLIVSKLGKFSKNLNETIVKILIEHHQVDRDEKDALPHDNAKLRIFYLIHNDTKSVEYCLKNSRL